MLVDWGGLLYLSVMCPTFYCAQVKYRLQSSLIMERLKSIRDGFYLPLKIYAPLSIISYFNEVQNGCFDPFTNSCPQPPSYYYFPLIAALFLALTFLANAWRLRSHERDFSKGLALGTVVGASIFFIFMMGGFWGWDLFI